MQKPVETAQALARKYPEQVALVTTQTAAGQPNVMAAGWVTIASGAPPMFVLCLNSGSYTYELIAQTKEFVIAFPSEQMARETLIAGSHSGRDSQKFAATGIRTQAATVVKAPLVADAAANFECTLVEITKPGDHALIVGKVAAAHANQDEAVQRLYTLAKGHKLGGVRPAATA